VITTNINDNVNLPEYGKFVRIDGDTNFPPISVLRPRYPDTSQAYNNAGANPVSAFEVDIYPKYAILTYQVGSTVSSSLTSTQNQNVNVTPTESLFLPGTTAVTALTGSGSFAKLWIYPVKSFSGGIPTFNAGNVYIGKSSSYLPDILTPSGGPISIQLPTGQQLAIANINIKCVNSSDGVFFSWT